MPVISSQGANFVLFLYITPGKEETIFPRTQATSLIVGRVVFKSVWHAVWRVNAFPRVSVTVMVTELRTNHRITNCWEGVKTDLSG